MAKLVIIALSGVVYRVKSTVPSTEPCGTPYKSVILSYSVCSFYGLVTNFSKKEKAIECNGLERWLFLYEHTEN